MLVQQYGNTHIKSYIKETDLMNGVILKRFKNFSKEYLLFIERYLIPCKYLPHQEIIYQFYHKDSGAKGLSRVRNWGRGKIINVLFGWEAGYKMQCWYKDVFRRFVVKRVCLLGDSLVGRSFQLLVIKMPRDVVVTTEFLI